MLFFYLLFSVKRPWIWLSKRQKLELFRRQNLFFFFFFHKNQNPYNLSLPLTLFSFFSVFRFLFFSKLMLGALWISPSLSHSVVTMFLDKGLTQSNLDFFLHCTTPVVSSQFLPKVYHFFGLVQFLSFGFINVYFCWRDCWFSCSRLRLGTLTRYGTHGRGRRLSTSR